MKTYNIKEKPLKVFGIPFFEEKKAFERIPLRLREEISSLEFLGRRCPGARVGFRTDAEEFTVKVSLKTLSVDIGISIFGCQSISVMIGDRQTSRFAGLGFMMDYDTKTYSETFRKDKKLEEVTIWLPRNEELESVEVIFPDEATVLEPTPYKYGKALFYGSSITEGGCCTGTKNAYSAILSRWLDLDYYNFGFSGSAKGELQLADYINTIDMNLFVYDYDHNAPDTEHLRKTHEPFFLRIREKHPDIPIVMMSCPDFDYVADAKERRDIIRETYNNAIARGDTNVYFVDGETFFDGVDRHLCTIDMTHPNDLGMYRMAEVLYPLFKEILEKNN